MYRLKMSGSRTIMLLMAVVLCLAGLAACGSDSATESAAANTVADPADDPSEASSTDDDEHSDEHDDEHDDDKDHDDEHSDDDKDHDDDEHDDDHDDEHSDDEHDDHDEHDDDASGGLGAHVHGEAELLVAWNDSDVVIDLISPTDNIFGFEYEPTADADVALAAERTETLTAPGMLVFNPEAGCSIDDAPVTDVVFEGSHAEITASWFFTCDNPDQIAELDTAPLFAAFPGLVDVDAQWASDTGQSAVELSASSTVVRFG